MIIKKILQTTEVLAGEFSKSILVYNFYIVK